MQVKDVMTSRAEWVDPKTSIADAAKLMREHDFGVLPVGDGDRLIGMITDRDLAIRAVAERRDPATTTVADIMTDNVLYCFEDQQAEDVARNMGEQRIRRLPVVNREKRLVGMVSIGDLAQRGLPSEAGKSLGAIAKH